MAEKVILAETTLSFAYSFALGVYANTDETPNFILETGKDYTVEWDGNRVTRTAFAFTFADGSNCVGVGNPLAAGQASNGDVFCVAYDMTHNMIHYLSLEQTASHTVAVYEVVAAEVGIVQYDRAGNRMEFYGKDTLRVDTTDGGTMDFVHADLVEKTVELDFSNGDMAIETMTGELFNKVIIPPPATLIPANVAEGVNVAGIIGALKGGSGAKFATGTFTGTGGAVTVEHGLGVIPDIVFVCARSISTDKTNLTFKMACAISSAVQSALGNNWAQWGIYSHFVSGSNHRLGISTQYNTTALDLKGGNALAATEATFRFGAATITTQWQTDPTATYDWFAIGGLT